ncbi:hypothetical protein [Saccharopolyspora kobensis]|uniref:hypothetical protein n=1 Tax=Saccharopolyspora kobensis TaxID=146035 RepID=UPI0011612419|nr:hypothetical protein [Saccharopolyspora kobensis]
MAATIGLGALLGSPLLMSWVEHRMLGRRPPAGGRHRQVVRPNLLVVRWRYAIPVPRRVPAGGPGAMRKPGPRRSFDRPTPVPRRAKQRS